MVKRANKKELCDDCKKTASIYPSIFCAKCEEIRKNANEKYLAKKLRLPDTFDLDKIIRDKYNG